MMDLLWLFGKEMEWKSGRLLPPCLACIAVVAGAAAAKVEGDTFWFLRRILVYLLHSPPKSQNSAKPRKLFGARMVQSGRLPHNTTTTARASAAGVIRKVRVAPVVGMDDSFE